MAETIVNVTINDREANVVLDSLQKRLRELVKAQSEAFDPKKKKEYQEEIDNIRGAVRALNSEISDTPSKVADTTKEFKTFGDTMDSMLTGGLELLSQVGVDTKGLQKIYASGKKTLDQYNKSTVSASIAQKANALATGLATAAQRAFSAALIATGIGAFVVAIGSLLANWKSLVEVIRPGTKATREFGEAMKDTQKDIAKVVANISELEETIQLAKDGFIDKEEALKLYNETLGESVGYAEDLEQAESLLVANASIVIEITKQKALAESLYARAAEARAKVIAGDETLKPDFWESLGRGIQAAGNVTALVRSQAKDIGENIVETIDLAETLEQEADATLKTITELESKLTTGGLSPGEMKRLANERKQAIKEVGKLSRADLGAEEVSGISPLGATELPELKRDKQIVGSAEQTAQRLTEIDNDTRARRDQEAKEDLDKARSRVDQNLAMIEFAAGRESDIGKAAFIARSSIRIKEQIEEAKATLARVTLRGAEAQADTAAGFASTSKVGFPQNIPLLIAFAAQSAGIIASVKQAVSAARSQANSMGAGGGSVGSISAGGGTANFAGVDFSFLGDGDSASASEFQSLDQDQQTTRGVRAYVASTDITDQQNLDQKVTELASLNGD